MNKTTDFEQELILLRPYLLKFANIQLRNSALAEDVVSETVLAAFTQQEQFREQSSIKTYLIVIGNSTVVLSHPITKLAILP